MPPNFTRQIATARMGVLPNAFPEFGKLSAQPNGGSNSIWANMFQNVIKDPNLGYTRDDAQMITGAEAYFGSTEVIASTTTVMTLTDMNWLTKVISPWRVMDENVKTFSWNKTKFKPHMATEVPHLGVVRLVRSERTTAKAGMKRWGMGYAMEHDFMNTREGLRYHLAHLQQMSNAMLEAVKHDIIFTLLDAYSFERTYIREKKLYKAYSPERYFREQAWMFASLQKEKHAIEKLDSEINERLYRWRGVANTWIMPPQIIRYLSQVPPENTTYSEAGPAGPQRLLDGPTPFGVLAKQPVYIARSFYTDQLSSNASLLEDSREFGEYYRMSETAYDPDVPYRSKHRSIMIYNFGTDSFSEISLQAALDHSYLFGANGEPIRLEDSELQYPSRLPNQHDRERDIFRYATATDSGKYVYADAELCGEIELNYWSVENKIHQALSGMDSIATKMGRDAFNRMMADLNAGKALAEQIDRIPASSDFNTKLYARFGGVANSTEQSPRSARGIHSIFQKNEFKQDPITGFIWRADHADLDELLPGLQSLGGFRYILAKGSAALATEKAIINNFLTALSQLVGYVRELFPKSIYLNPDFVSPHIHYPTPEAAFFERFVLGGGFRPPIFLATGDAGNAGDQSRAAAIEATRADINAKIVADLKMSDAVPVDTNAALAYYLRLGILAATQGTKPSPAEVASIKNILGIQAAAMNPGWAGASESETASRASAALVELAQKHPNLGFGEFAREEIAANYIGQLREAFGLLAAGAGNLDTAKYARTPLLASANFARTLQATGARVVAVAEPIFTELPASLNRVDQAAQLGLIGREFAGQQQQLPMSSNVLFMNMLSAAVGMNSMEVGAAARNPPVPADAPASVRRRSAELAERLRRTTEVNTRGLARAPLSDHLRKLLDFGERLMSKNFSRSFREIESSSENPFVQALAHIYDGTPIHKAAFDSFIRNNIRVPLDFIITRPHISVRQLTAIKMQAGSETMFTAVAPGQFELADDAATQGHIGTLTGRHKAVVITPENVYIVQGLFVNGVNGGLGVDFIDAGLYDGGRGDYSHQDIIVVPLGPGDKIEGSLFSLTGSLMLAEFEGLSLTQKQHLQYETVARMCKLWGFNESRFGVNYSETAVDAVASTVLSNVLCMPGTFIRCNTKTSNFDIVVQGQSLLQGLIYPGCAAVLSGKMTEVNRNPWGSYLQY